tara:strand:- start:7428 stop:7604 length:177 start_codon:yes stop_codon:yes gene_type:complete
MIKHIIKRYNKMMLNREESYLANSCDLVELERRQREIQRGNAPWQKPLIANPNLRGHV